jgi:hypothetical protein
MRTAIALGLFSLAIGAGCATPTPRVVTGAEFSTGNSAYDEFFAAVRAVRADALAAQNDESASHAGLIKALGLEAASPASLAIDEAGVRAKRFQEKGVLLHLEIAPEPHLVAFKGKAEIGPDNEALLKSMEEAARSSLEVRKKLAAVAARAQELEKKRATLRADAPATFRQDPQAKRDEIIAELDAAKQVLADAADAASRGAGSASRFVVELVQSVETGAGALLEPSKVAMRNAKKVPVLASPAPAPVASAAPPPAASPAKAAPPPAKAAPPPAAAPAKAAPPAKKKGGDDFEP